MALGWRGQYTRYRELFLNILSLYKKRRDLRMFLEIILSLVTIIIFLSFALKPTALTIIALVKEIDEKEKTIVALDQKIANLDIAREVYASIEGLVPIIDSAVPSEPKPERFVEQVQLIAAKNSTQILGVSVGEITLLGTKEKETKKKTSELTPLPAPSKEMSVSISISGTYQGIIATIRDLENLRRPIKIDSFGINSTTSESGKIIVAVVSGRIPYIKQ